MGLTTALNTSLNGLTLNETAIEVLGNNIANAGTNGFKASTVQFATQLSRTLSVGSAPTGSIGGTNPRQVGLGATTSAIFRDFSQGAITTSTSPSDLAVEGDGFFVLKGNAEGQAFTRNGNFALNSESKLVNAAGLRVQGYGIDDEFDIVTTQLADIEIPLGKLNVAQQTTRVAIEGALQSSSGDEATQPGVLQSVPLYNLGSQLVAPGFADPITQADAATTLLTDLATDDSLAATPLFVDGDTITLTPKKGGADYESSSFEVTATSTLAEYMQFLDESLGLYDDATIADSSFGPAGVSVTGGAIQIVSNLGTSQEVGLNGSAITRTAAAADSTASPVPFGFAAPDGGEAIGESGVVTFPVFDSLGQQLTVKMHATLVEKSADRTTIRYYLESTDDSDQDIFLASGTFVLNAGGEVTGTSKTTFTLNRTATAANDIDIEIDFSNISGLAPENANSTLNLLSQDGAPPGTLSSFNISGTGIISGVFSNGVIRNLGQVALARFPNPLGLVENGGNNYLEGVASGSAQIVTPGDQGSGSLRSGAIELSNTDIGRSLVDLIVASTNYRGNARVISSTQQLVDELLVLGR
jgi:flagellar hook protein FlgE